MPTCEVCRREFESPKKRSTCSRSCAAKITYLKRNQAWLPDSEAWLEKHVGVVPLNVLVEDYHQVAAINGWPPRTKHSISIKIQKLGLRQRCRLDNVTRAELGRILGISHSRVKTWTRRGLPFQIVALSQSAVRIRDVKRFLLKHPGRAVGVNPEALAWLIGEDVADSIMKRITKNRIPGMPRPVVNLTTGQTFPNVPAAAKASFVAANSIRKSITRGGTCASCRWVYLDELEAQS